MNAPFRLKATVKVEEAADSTVRLPREALTQLGLTPGDELDVGVTDSGVEMRPKESGFDRQMAVAREVMERRESALAELAK